MCVERERERDRDENDPKLVALFVMWSQLAERGWVDLVKRVEVSHFH